MKKCPECGIKHRLNQIAEHCNCRIQKEWDHFILLTRHMPGGATEENIQSRGTVSVEYFREVKKRKEEMEKYIETLPVQKEDENRSLEGWAKIILGKR